jgi:cell division protein ZipA
MLQKRQQWQVWERNSVESLRWILIAAGIVFIVAIYLLGKNRRESSFFNGFSTETNVDISVDTNVDTSTEKDLDMGLPEFSANSLDNVDEGVGAVRIISGGDPYDESRDEMSSPNGTNDVSENTVGNGKISDSTNNKPNDIIVVYILPKGDAVLEGSQINSSAQALGLSFGEMNIFHYMRDGQSVFSLANMLEPGSFNIETIHALTTSGLTIFLQIKGDDPMDDLTEMLQRSYQLAGLLEARLCNHKREPLTEQDAENYRSQVRDLI